MGFNRVCVDCKTDHRAHEGALDDEGLLVIKFRCPKCQKPTMKRVDIGKSVNVTLLSGFSFKDNRGRGGRPRVY